ncbi:MAG: PQQ-binding-like beta-propeller repeat protein [Gemmatales bacterium]
MICLNAADGKDVWKIKRPSDGTDENPHSYASAQLWHKGDNAYLVVHGNDYTTAHDLKDGHEIRRLTGLNPAEKYNKFLRFVASPLVTPDLIIVPTAKNGPVVAVKPNAQGEFGPGSSYEQWRMERVTPDVPCPLLVDGLVFLCNEGGVFTCIDAETGKEQFKQRLYSNRYRASPIYADGKIYCTARDGTITVLKVGKTFEPISVNKLPDQVTASPIVSGGKIYVRGFEKLWCIGK